MMGHIYMNEKKWKIEFINEPWMTTKQPGTWMEGMGFYRIIFEGNCYGMISKEAFDDKKTGDILEFVEQMLNDAHSLALKEHD